MAFRTLLQQRAGSNVAIAAAALDGYVFNTIDSLALVPFGIHCLLTLWLLAAAVNTERWTQQAGGFRHA